MATTAEFRHFLELSRHNDKYYKKFDFFYRRTSFRTMTEFYKSGFKPMLEKWREFDKKVSFLAT